MIVYTRVHASVGYVYTCVIHGCLFVCVNVWTRVCMCVLAWVFVHMCVCGNLCDLHAYISDIRVCNTARVGMSVIFYACVFQHSVCVCLCFAQKTSSHTPQDAENACWPIYSSTGTLISGAAVPTSSTRKQALSVLLVRILGTLCTNPSNKFTGSLLLYWVLQYILYFRVRTVGFVCVCTCLCV